MANIIEARVRQKTDTLANWNANELELLGGEAAFIVGAGGEPVNFRLGDGTKKFSELPNWIQYDQAAFIKVATTALPTPTIAAGYSIVGEGTYTKAGQASVIVSAGSMGILDFAGGVWSLSQSVLLPITPVSDEIIEGGELATSQDAVFKNLDKKFINKGKSYPYINQTEINTAVRKINNVILDTQIEETSHRSDLYYTITLIARNASVNQWGNAIHIRVYNSSDLSVFTSMSFRSTDSSISPTNLIQLSKIEQDGLQLLSLQSDTLGKTFHILIDSDSILDNEVIDASYSSSTNKMYLSGSVYKIFKNIPSISNLATKTELNAAVNPIIDNQNKLNQLSINQGKDYPMTGIPTSSSLASKITLLKNTILDCVIIGADYENYTYYVSGIYKNHPVSGNGIILSRRAKSNGVIGGQVLSDITTSLSIKDRNSLSRIGLSSGYVRVNAFNSGWGINIELLINVDELTGTFTDINYSSPTGWETLDFSSEVYNLTITDINKILPKYPTFKQAVVAKKLGLIKVGSMLAESIVDTINFSGSGASYKPSQLWKQYRRLGSNSIIPKALSQIIDIKNEDGSIAYIKSFGKRYIYFGNGNNLYRTQHEFINDITTPENTSYEKIILQDPLPDSYRTTVNSIMSCFELDNGELLIEVRNGIKEDPVTDYRGHRTQLYLTTGFKNAPRSLNINNVLEINLIGLVRKVHEYKALTQTQGKAGTTVSIVGSKIALSPYYIGRTGLVHYSSDYGNTWKIIFNMGVEDEIFSVPYKGSSGAWPLPENLTPVMPMDMWTAGGNDNSHTHGVTIDPYMDSRIWVSTGDSGTNALGRTALWYTDDEGLNWTRMQTKGSGVLDSFNGLQPMGVVSTKDYILVGSDSPTDGLYRWSRSKKSDIPTLEAAYWYGDAYSTALRVIYGGSIITREGYVYSLLHPNTPDRYDKGNVVFTADGLEFVDCYFDEVSNGTSSGDRNINWGSWIGQDRFNNIYIANANGKLIKLY